MDTNLVFQLLPRNGMLSPVEGGFYVELPRTPAYFLENEVLERIDPRLPDGIRLLKDVRDFDKVPTSAIVIMLHLWQATIHIKNASDDLVGMSRVGNITELQSLVRVQCDGYIYTQAISNKTGEVLNIPTDTATSLCLIKKSWLTAAYPGWQERLKVACDIGVDYTHAMQHMVSAGDPSIAVALPADLTP